MELEIILIFATDFIASVLPIVAAQSLEIAAHYRLALFIDNTIIELVLTIDPLTNFSFLYCVH